MDIQKYRELTKGNKLIFDTLIRPPYNNMLYIFQATELPNILKGIFGDKDIEPLEQLYSIIGSALNIDINKTLRLVEIEDDLMNLVKDTDNKIFHRPLFFPTVFINNDIEYDGTVIKGILISEALHSDEKVQLVYGDLYEDYGKFANDYEIFYISIDTKYDKTSFRLMSLIYPKKSSDSSESGIRVTNIDNLIRNIVVNIVDMVEGNDEDLEVTTIISTLEQNAKRLKRGKVPFPTKVFIRANKEFKQYVKDFNETDEECKETKLTCKFLVRGHWMHFRSERYVRKKGEKTWVKPFYKGQGIVVAKPYKLVN